MRKTRWAWYFLMIGIGAVCAEGLSWSTPVIYPIGVWVLIVYGLHYLLIVDYLLARRALTVRALAAGGFVLGITTESLMTKVIWNPPWNSGSSPHLLGLDLYGVGFVVMVWHAWMSMAVPFALSLTAFGHAALLTPRQVRRILLVLPFTMAMGAALNPDPARIGLALLGIPLNAAGILGSAWLYRRYARRVPLRSIDDLRLTRGERRIAWGLILFFYAISLPLRADAYPPVGPFLLGMLLIAVSLRLLASVRRADTQKIPPPGEVSFTARGFRRYVVYFALASVVLVALVLITTPASGLLTLALLLLFGVRGEYYLLRLIRNVGLIRPGHPRERHPQGQVTEA